MDRHDLRKATAYDRMGLVIAVVFLRELKVVQPCSSIAVDQDVAVADVVVHPTLLMHVAEH